MELRQLRYFVTLCETMHYRKAAETLNLSQPPLSRQIAALESEIGVKLTRKKGRSFELTSAGTYFRDEAVRILNASDTLINRTRLMDEKPEYTIKLGCVGSLMFTFFPSFLSYLAERLPRVRIEIEELDTEAQGRALLGGRLDVGFVRSWISRSGLRYERLGQESMSLLFPSEFDVGSSPSLKDFSSFPFVKGTAPGLSEFISGLCRSAGFDPLVAVECSQFASILKLVSTGLGWSVVPTLALSRFDMDGLRAMTLEESVEFGLAYRGEGLPARVAEIIRVSKYFISDIGDGKLYSYP